MLAEQLHQARQEAAYYRKLAQECGERRQKESEALSVLIEELRRTELALTQARNEADTANHAKSMFLATMSHELRTPLTAIIGYSQLMEQLVKAGDYHTVATDLQHIYTAGRHLLTLINDVLDLSRIEAGQLLIAADRVDVADLIASVTTAIHPLITQNRNTLEISCPDQIVMMYTDPFKLRQSLLNLLSNAAKFTEAGTIRLCVTQEYVDGADWVTFTVADSGIGISADQMPKLFKPFSQIDDSLNRRYGGTGLGLVLSQRLCQLLGGDITVASTFGVGSIFAMRLPAIIPSDSANLPVAMPHAAPPAAVRAPEEIAPIISENIVLVIDDDLAAGDLIAQLIGPERACVVHAASAAEGVDLARAILPDLIFLDMLMPGVDGWQVLAALKADPEIASIPVVMIGIDDQRQRGLTLGVADVISKPFTPGCLTASIRWLPVPTPSSGYILVAANDRGIVDMLRHTLEGVGWRVAVAWSGRETLTAVTTHPPAAIMLDLLLPDMDGVQLIHTLRERPGRIECPITIMAPGGLSSAARAQLHGSAHHILHTGANTLDRLARQLHGCLVPRRTIILKNQADLLYG